MKLEEVKLADMRPDPNHEAELYAACRDILDGLQEQER